VWRRKRGEAALDGSRAEYYRGRARMVRALAAACSTPAVKEEYLRIAAPHEQLATEVEQGHLKPSRPAPSRAVA